MKSKKEKVVVVSGGFDPIHVGHIRMIQDARKFGDRIIVVLNNDHWLRKKKGIIFMPQRERKEILEAIIGVDQVILTRHKKNTSDMSIKSELKRLRPDVFANGGDRFRNNIPEVALAKKIGCRLVFNVGHGGKVQSSSWLLSKYIEQKRKK